jgi:diguanylate cyclase (GGDEF)-like protein
METEKPKVLCVDDELGILDSLERTLRRRFDVLLASDTIDAFNLIEQNTDIAVVISDHILGSDRGVDFLTQVKKTLPTSARVLLSGQIDMRSMEDAINDANVHKFIMKPWENDQLLLNIVEAYKTHKTLVEKEKLHTLAITDPVTQLTNHRFFQEKLRLEWDKAQKSKKPLSLIMIDIDHFKKFNDRFGHPEGDKILALISAELQSATPDFATISRYGGEEFAVILSNTTSEAALMSAEKLRSQVLQTSFHDYPLSISLGVATSPQHANSVDELIISADQSLYQAKRRGRNQTVVGLSFEH